MSAERAGRPRLPPPLPVRALCDPTLNGSAATVLDFLGLQTWNSTELCAEVFYFRPFSYVL